MTNCKILPIYGIRFMTMNALHMYNFMINIAVKQKVSTMLIVHFNLNQWKLRRQTIT